MTSYMHATCQIVVIPPYPLQYPFILTLPLLTPLTSPLHSSPLHSSSLHSTPLLTSPLLSPPHLSSPIRYVIGSCIKHIPLAGRTITQYIQQLMRERKEPIPAEVCQGTVCVFGLFPSSYSLHLFTATYYAHTRILPMPPSASNLHVFLIVCTHLYHPPLSASPSTS